MVLLLLRVASPMITSSFATDTARLVSAKMAESSMEYTRSPTPSSFWPRNIDWATSYLLFRSSVPREIYEVPDVREAGGGPEVCTGSPVGGVPPTAGGLKPVTGVLLLEGGNPPLLLGGGLPYSPSPSLGQLVKVAGACLVAFLAGGRLTPIGQLVVRLCNSGLRTV